MSEKPKTYSKLFVLSILIWVTKVEAIESKLTLKDGNVIYALSDGRKLEPGAILQVGDDVKSLAMEINGVSVLVSPNSSIVVGQGSVQLKSGEISIIRTNKTTGSFSGDLSIYTLAGNVPIVGDQEATIRFLPQYGSMVVISRSNELEVKSSDGKAIELSAGDTVVFHCENEGTSVAAGVSRTSEGSHISPELLKTTGHLQ